MVKRLLVLNGLAIIGVVIHHSTQWVLTAMFFWADKYRPVTVPNFDQINSFNYIFLRLLDQISLIGVPSFLFISGTFVAVATGRNQTTVSWSIIISRVKRLLFPYLLWSILIVVTRSFLEEGIKALEFVQILVSGGAAVGFYYVPMLIVYLILSPFIVPFAKTRWRILLLVSALIQFTVILFRYSYLLGYEISSVPFIDYLILDTNVPANIFWFVLGLVAGFRLKEFEEWLTQYHRIFALSFAVAFILSFIEWEFVHRITGREWLAAHPGLAGQAYLLFLLLFFLGLDSVFLLRYRLYSKLSSQSYGIYLVHVPTLEFTARLVYHIAPWLLGYFIPFQALLVSAGIGVPLSIMEIVNRSPFRRYYRYIFG